MHIHSLSTIYIFLVLTVASETIGQMTEEKTTWGVYQIHRGAERFEAGLKTQITQLGAVPKHVLFFRDMHPERGFPTATVEVCRQYGVTPIISKELWQWSERKAERSDWLERINSGKTDDYWREWAKAAKSFESEIILRFGFEMNGDWFGWGQQPEAFIAAWRRVYTIIRDDIGARNVQFMFSPNIEWDTTRQLTAIELYYPGDEFVERLGLDGYNFGDFHSEWHQWQTYEAIFEKSIQKMSQWKKPLMLAEIGCADGPRKAKWVEAFLKSVRSDPRVEGFIYFNHFDPRKGEPNWRLNSDPEALEIFRRMTLK
jgi:hypothetical protein